MNRITLTPELAAASGLDAANAQMRKAGRTSWNEDDHSRAVEVHARLLKSLPHPWPYIAAGMLGEAQS